MTSRAELELAPILARMLAALRHRGPDDEGTVELSVHNGYRLGLAHTRLAVLDTTPAGHQPMGDPESGSWITYNGEVYNHQHLRRELGDSRFRSTSDTETILKGWTRLGDNVLSSLRGMFAFALYDGARGQLWLVRDRLGVKPLYASRVAADTWLFASELRALAAGGLFAPRLNPAAVESYLAFGAVAAPWTLLDPVQSLLAGEAWRFDLTRCNGTFEPERKRYWRPSFAAPAARPQRVKRAYQEAVERLRPVLLEAVGLRMVSDVPVGVFLSGGIDSSSVVAALAAQGHTLRTFSVVFDEHPYDESRHSKQVARRFGAEHTELFLRPADVLDQFDQAIAAYDQPSIDGVNTFFISQATRRAGVKVALSGLGGDELFAGYPYFRLLARLERGPVRHLARLVHAVLGRTAPRSTRTAKLGAILQGGRSRLANYAVCRLVMGRERRKSLFSQPPPAGRTALPPEVCDQLADDAQGLDAVNAQSLLELSLYLANMLLRDTDQMSMAHALEVREPLLDHVLVETVAQIQGPLKLVRGRRSRTKSLLVDALPDELPRQVLRRRKMGFVLPWEIWLRRELKSRVTEILGDRASLEATGLDARAVGRLWGDYLACRPGVRYTDILSLVHLLAWVRRHGWSVAGSCQERHLDTASATH